VAMVHCVVFVVDVAAAVVVVDKSSDGAAAGRRSHAHCHTMKPNLLGVCFVAMSEE